MVRIRDKDCRFLNHNFIDYVVINRKYNVIHRMYAVNWCCDFIGY